ncbi:MAG: hypothetical protein ACRYFK_16740 [Janthinobacterium lividum]
MLLLLALLSLGLGSCTSYRTTHRGTIHHYRRIERQHERERRREVKTNVTWSLL